MFSSAPGQPPDVPKGAPVSQLKILIVDDNHLNQQMLLSIFTLLGHKTDIADSGSQALELISEKTYDLLLLESNLPDLFLNRLLTDFQGLAPEVKPFTVAFTGRRVDEAKDEFESKLTNIDAFLPKPHKLGQIQELAERVATLKGVAT